LLIQRYPTGFIEPTNSIPQLEKEITSLNKKPTLVIDLTRGKLASSLSSIASIPQWNSFSIGRIREATKVDLPTSGHILSHNTEEIRDQLIDLDTSRILLLDDTSFSGTTSLLVEDLLMQSFPEREIQFTHGFLIVNTGKLGNQDGAYSQISKSGSRVISGFKMETPKDDGWHFFDIVDQDHIEDHFSVVKEILGLLQLPNFEHLITSFLSNEDVLQVMFPQLMPADDLLDKQKSGHFLARRSINGGFHVRNPQLLPNIIGQNHLLAPPEWKAHSDEVFKLLIQINQLLQKGNI
jgi:hypothetical protein